MRSPIETENKNRRTDQIDTAALLSSYTEIDIVLVDGVREVTEKAIPPGKGAQVLSKAELGCWRAHLNMLRMVIDRRLETALILEADVDWDIRIKDQLTLVSENIPDSTLAYPYGKSQSPLC